MEEKIKKWIFIGGAPRSGTSLLQAIFNQHTMCSSPPESHILETFVYAPVSKAKEALKSKPLLKKFIENDKWISRLNVPVDAVLEKFPEGSSGLHLFKIYMEEYIKASEKTILVEGAPLNIWYLKKLHTDFPSCYILHIVRDPRDVILSTEKASYNKAFDFPPDEIAYQFMESYMQGPRFGPSLYGNHYIKIYYEDLITNPEKTVRLMCDKLNIEFQPAMLEFQKSSQRVAAKEEDWKENLSKPFIKDNFGKWKSEMDGGILKRTEYICRSFFRIEKDHYATGTPASAIDPSLLPLYIKSLKGTIRKAISGKKSIQQLDLFPPHERMRSAGLLDED